MDETNDTPETLHTVALKMVDTLDSLGILPEITDTIRQAIREPMMPPAPTDEELDAWIDELGDKARDGEGEHYWALGDVQTDDIMQIARAALQRWAGGVAGGKAMTTSSDALLNRCIATYNSTLDWGTTIPWHREAIRQVVLQVAAELLVMHQRNDGRLSAHDAAQMLREGVG